MLPIVLQMQIDLSVAAHHREVAEGFAKLRTKLTPRRELTLQDLLCAAGCQLAQQQYLDMQNMGMGGARYGVSPLWYSTLGGIFG